MTYIEAELPFGADTPALTIVERPGLLSVSSEVAREHFLVLWSGMLHQPGTPLTLDFNGEGKRVPYYDDPEIMLVASRRYPNEEKAAERNIASRILTASVEDKRQSVDFNFNILERNIDTYDFSNDPFVGMIMDYFRNHLRSRRMLQSQN